MSKFKVGDYVRRTRSMCSDMQEGDEGYVTRVCESGDVMVEGFKFSNSPAYLELAEPAKFALEPASDPAPAIDAHYTKYAIQPMEFSLANGLDAAQHTVIKYVVRYRDKGGVRDLRAAIRVLELMIEREEKAND